MLNYWVAFGLAGLMLILGFILGLVCNIHDLGGRGALKPVGDDGLTDDERKEHAARFWKVATAPAPKRCLIASGMIDVQRGTPNVVVHVFADGGAFLHGGGKCRYCVPQA